MRWLVASSVGLALALPAPGQDDEAEKLFRSMEKKVAGARAVLVRFEYRIAPGKVGEKRIKGRLALAPDNRLRVVVEGPEEGSSGTVVSDGKTITITGWGQKCRKPQEQLTPEHLNALIIASLNRGGAMLGAAHTATSPWLWREVKPADIGAMLFELGPKEKIGGRDARKIEYTYTRGPISAIPPLRVQLWIDTKTLLPLRRVFPQPDGSTETYTEFTLDPTLPGGEFDLPK
jgi:outer membrane lipoprotein-sorting protein